MKTAKSFRLSNDAIQMLKCIAEKTGLSEAGVLELAIRDLGAKYKCKLTGKNSKP